MWLTCGECSSLGLDKCNYYGDEKMPETGVCDSCGGPWPKYPNRKLDDVVNQLKVDLLKETKQ